MNSIEKKLKLLDVEMLQEIVNTLFKKQNPDSATDMVFELALEELRQKLPEQEFINVCNNL